MPDIPQVSVVLPVRNGEQFIYSSMASILKQVDVNYEIIVINDGSVDATSAILNSFSDHRIRIITTLAMGITSALNTGIAAARSPIIARMDADDISLPHRLKSQLKLMDTYDFVFSDAMLIDIHGRAIGAFGDPRMLQDRRKSVLLAESLGPSLVHPTAMMRRSAILSLGGYRESPFAEDHDLWLRAIDTFRFAGLPDKLLQRRLHPDGVSHKNREEQIISTITNCVCYRLKALRGIDLYIEMPDEYRHLRAAVQSIAGDLPLKQATARRLKHHIKQGHLYKILPFLVSKRILNLLLLSREYERSKLKDVQDSAFKGFCVKLAAI